MIKKLSEDDVQQWLRWIELSKKWRETQEEKWSRMIGYLKGKFLDTAPPADYVAVNLVYPALRVIVPAIYSKNPDLVVKARKRGYEEGAKAMAQLLRYFMDELDLKKEVKLCLVDAVLTGHAWAKVGYQVDFEEIEEAAKTVKQRFKEALKKGKEALKAMITGVPPDESYSEKSYYPIEPNQKIVGERPWVRRVSPFDMYVPPYSKRDDELPWKVEQWVRDFTDVKNNPEFTIPSDFRPSGDVRKLLVSRDQMQKATKIESDEDEFQYVIGYEIWDARTNCVYTIAEDNKGVLKAEENVYSGIYDTRDCYEMLRINEVTDDFYPMSEIEAWEAQLHELNDCRTQQNTHRKRANRRYIYVEGAFKPEDLDSLKAGADNTFVPTAEENPSEVVYPIPDAQLSGDIYAAEVRIKGDITEISGITGYQRGSTEGGANSATEAAIVESQSQYRIQDRIDAVGCWVQKIIVKIAQVSQFFLEIEQINEILGDDAIFWVNLKNKEQIRGEFLYQVIYGSTSPINVETERTQAAIKYRELSQNPIVDLGKITVDYLRSLGTLDPESYLIPEAATMLNQARVQQAMMQAMGVQTEGESGLVDPYGAPVSPGGQKGEQIGEFGTPSPASMLSSFKRTGDVRPPGSQGGGGPLVPV